MVRIFSKHVSLVKLFIASFTLINHRNVREKLATHVTQHLNSFPTRSETSTDF